MSRSQCKKYRKIAENHSKDIAKNFIGSLDNHYRSIGLFDKLFFHMYMFFTGDMVKAFDKLYKL